MGECLFCGKKESEVAVLIASDVLGREDIRICDMCALDATTAAFDYLHEMRSAMLSAHNSLVAAHGVLPAPVPHIHDHEET